MLTPLLDYGLDLDETWLDMSESVRAATREATARHDQREVRETEACEEIPHVAQRTVLRRLWERIRGR
jgi:hypothetical protein